MKNKQKDYSKALEMSEKLGQESSEKDIKKIEKKLAFMNKGAVKKVWDKVEFLWSNINNSDIPKKQVYSIIGALLYLILPFDLVPDVIPVVGLLDDVAVITYIYNELMKIVTAIYKNYEKQAFSTIDETLEKSFKGMLLNASITFIITLAYALVKIFQPFNNYSNLVARIILLGNSIWFVVRIIIYFYKYGKIIIPGLKYIKKEKNVRNGIIVYVRQEYKSVNTIYKALKIVNKLNSEIPAPDEIIDVFIKHYRKRVILAVVFIAIISLTMMITRWVL